MAASDTSIVRRFEEAQNSLVLQSSDLSLETIAKMVESEAIDVSPHYQRRERWNSDSQAKLIESFLLNVPVPPVYLAEDDFGTYSVIDGKQRISAIFRFLRDQLILDDLTGFAELNKLKFSQLPKPLQNALSIRPYLRVVTLLKQTDPELKYEVFTRLNTGGHPLLAQEIRNALYRGPLNDLLFKLGENVFLRQQLKIATEKESAYAEMLDVEMPLRFFTFREQWTSFGGNSRGAMDDFMARHRKSSKAALLELEELFTKAINTCEDLWGEDAFRRFSAGAFRDQFLASIYDAQMIAVDLLSPAELSKVRKNKSALLSATKELFADKRFEESVRASTNTPSRVRFRIESVLNMLKAI
ncbi:MAG: DUF262 domain-containing protein [Betaproteobacteria bacterium]|nr:DUF262 domain-containing protein [Betaproteobacteria bacterium]